LFDSCPSPLACEPPKRFGREKKKRRPEEKGDIAMKPTFRIIAAFILFQPVVFAQQSGASGQAPAPATGLPQTAPKPQPGCSQPPAPVPAPVKKFRFKLPKAVQQEIDKKRAEIQNKTGVTVPPVSAEEMAKQAAAAKPCTPAPAPSAPVVPAPAPSAKQ